MDATLAVQATTRPLHKACGLLPIVCRTLHAARRMPHAARRTGFCVMGECRKRTESGWCSTCGAGSIARIFPALIVQLPELFVANIFHRKVVQALLLQWGTDH